MDFRVFNPFTPYHNSTLDTCYTRHERTKIHAQVREVEHGTFASSDVFHRWSRHASKPTSDLQTSGRNPTVLLCADCVVPYPSVCSIQARSSL